jgi:SagB-type dehydrogenase family enzyme
MRITASRSVKRLARSGLVPLPALELRRATLAEAIDARRSRREFAPNALALRDLAAVLHAAYGVTGAIEGTPQTLRTVPSGGALYPLELYCASHRVEGLGLALHHYDPLRHGLEFVRLLDAPAGDDLTPYGAALSESAAVIAMSAVFWRSRFKYGARAYRFTLIEAGHVAQNILLAAAALGLSALPVGGFYDRDVDAFLGVDGIYEAFCTSSRSDTRRDDETRDLAPAAWCAVAVLGALLGPAVPTRPDAASRLGRRSRSALPRCGVRRARPAPRHRLVVRRASRERLLARGAVLIAKSAEEEAIWRASSVLGALVHPLGAARALAVSTVLFAAAHVGRLGRRAWWHLATGATFGLAYLATGRLIAAIAAHGTPTCLVGVAPVATPDMAVSDTGGHGPGS